jgi:nucleoside-diphosphate-sugar epimerase
MRGGSEAVTGCRYVLHVASPLPRSAAKNDDELVVPARDGTLRVLRAAHAAGVERVVLTSSISAIVYGNDRSQNL